MYLTLNDQCFSLFYFQNDVIPIDKTELGFDTGGKNNTYQAPKSRLYEIFLNVYDFKSNLQYHSLINCVLVLICI